MIRFEATVTHRMDGSAIVAAYSKRCAYTVRVEPSSVHLHGPGVEEYYDREEDLPRYTSPEALAIAAIMEFEEGE